MRVGLGWVAVVGGCLAVSCGATPDRDPIGDGLTSVAGDGSGSAGSTSSEPPGGADSGPGTDSGGSTAAIDTDGPKLDVQGSIDLPPEQCVDCTLTIASQQSGTFDIMGANIFGTAELQAQIVYALGTHGAGRFVASADSSLPFNEVTDCPLLEWLAATDAVSPRLFWFGWTPGDGPINWSVPGEVSAGVHLPAQYLGNPAQLLADFDVVMYLEASGQFDAGDQPTDQEIQTLLDYVSIHGGGLYAVSEFADPAGNAYLQPQDLVSVNRLMVPLGVQALQVSLNWGDVNGNIEFECFPDPPE